MTHRPQDILGYTGQPLEKVELVNFAKRLEEVALRYLDVLPSTGADPRWVAVARTHLEQAFMAANRAVFQPQRISGALLLSEVSVPEPLSIFGFREPGTQGAGSSPSPKSEEPTKPRSKARPGQEEPQSKPQ